MLHRDESHGPVSHDRFISNKLGVSSSITNNLHCDNTNDLPNQKAYPIGEMGRTEYGEILHKNWCTVCYLTNQQRQKKIRQRPEET